MALKPGVVSGEDYITLVNACKEGGYALAAVNCVGTDSVNAVMEAAAKNKSDIIIQLSNGGRFSGESPGRGIRGAACASAGRALRHLRRPAYGSCESQVGAVGRRPD